MSRYDLAVAFACAGAVLIALGIWDLGLMVLVCALLAALLA